VRSDHQERCARKVWRDQREERMEEVGTGGLAEAYLFVHCLSSTLARGRSPVRRIKGLKLGLTPKGEEGTRKEEKTQIKKRGSNELVLTVQQCRQNKQCAGEKKRRAWPPVAVRRKGQGNRTWKRDAMKRPKIVRANQGHEVRTEARFIRQFKSRTAEISHPKF